LNIFAGKLEKIRSNRINLELVRELILNHKGENKPLKAVANFRISPQAELVVANFEPKLHSLIKNTILENRSEYRLDSEKSTPSELYFILALMTKEIREKLIREVNSVANAGNIEIRKVRENFRKEIKRGKDFSQDQVRKYEKEIDELTKEYEKKLVGLEERKVKELKS
jgi:ribosome recycling factor